MFRAVKATSSILARFNAHAVHTTAPSMNPSAAAASATATNSNTKMPATRSRRPRHRGPPGTRGMASTATATATAPVQPNSTQAQTQAPGPARPLQKTATAAAPVARDESHFSQRRFADAPISEASKKGIQHEFLSDVQVATLDYALAGLDLLVQAKTGTGKTLAFLLPAVERLAQMDLVNRKISMLVLSPTRELALQIEEEAETLIKKHTFAVGHAIGGTNMKAEGKRLMEQPPRILISTPGRLVDHLENTPSFVHLFSDLRVIVYDEADRLLDQGFRRELDKILSYLPDKTKVKRQALLFSATVSEEIKGVAKGALAANYKFISTLRADEVNTHEHVPQQSLIVPFAHHLAATLAFLQQDRLVLNKGASKAMIFLPTARLVGFYYEALSLVPQGTLPPLFEIHSRLSQPKRIRAAEQFKDAKEGVLISSDVTARGMDFPNVTLILQPGLPPNSEQYIHRLGRTARAGASGRGILLLDPDEAFFLRDRTIASLPISPVPAVPTPNLYHLTPTELANAVDMATATLARVSADTKAAAYRAFLGVYNSSLKSLKWSRNDLVAKGNRFAVEGLGWTEASLPGIEKKTLGKMNLKGVDGLNVIANLAREPRGGGGGGRGGGGGGGGRGGPPRR